MKKSRYTVEQIIAAIKEVEGGRPIAEVIREKNVSQATFYAWRAKYGGASSKTSKKRTFEAENSCFFGFQITIYKP